MTTVFEHWLHISASLSLDRVLAPFRLNVNYVRNFFGIQYFFIFQLKRRFLGEEPSSFWLPIFPGLVFGVVSVGRTLPWASESEVPRQHLHWFVEDLFWRVFRVLNTIGDLKFLPLSNAFLAAHAFSIHRSRWGHVVVWRGTNCKFVHRKLGRGQPWVTENIL